VTCVTGFFVCFVGDLGSGVDAGGGSADRFVVSNAGRVARASVSGSALTTTDGGMRSHSLRRAGKPEVITVAGEGLYAAKPGLGERDAT
jgi:hypothetical protein